ncbi:replication initiation protein [Variovorax sp. OV329]|uniref:replication initiation protein n=1 Tax=Variovorax sp. OV329 TaxID=1882825 RepID=UPI0008F0FAAF|nr:replication initiation protein [Variovorax sp. OV329]SFN47686.1 Initiator Replication protein [Variovorax sp. OV329]
MENNEKPKARMSDEQTLAKANEAIAIRPKRGRLTLLSRRIYNALLYHSQRQGVDEPVYRLSLSELIGDAHFNSKNTELLKSHLRDMQATTIEWSTSSAGGQRWVSTQLIGTVTIEEQGRGRPCFVTWRYPEEIKERLVRPHQYTRVLLEMSGQMRSYSAAVLYEIGARYLTSPGKLTMREDVLWWASVLTGRSDLTEVDYRFFKRDVIAKALAEVEALCEDFSLELIEHKSGRKIEDIQFRVVPRVQQRIGEIDESTRNVFDLELVGQLIALGLKQEEAQDLYATTDEGQIRAAIDHVQQRLRNQSLPELKSPGAYLKDALKKGYAGTKEAAAPTLPSPRAGEGSAAQESDAERLQRLRELWQKDRMQEARDMFKEMSAQQQEELRARFDESEVEKLAAPIARSWRKDGPASRVASSAFFKWVANTTWPAPVTDRELLDFALSRGVAGI